MAKNTSSSDMLAPIPVDFVVAHAQSKSTDAKRKPYLELLTSWGAHEGRPELAKQLVDSMVKKPLADVSNMPKELYQKYRSGEKARQLIEIVRHLNDVITSGSEGWSWAHVMRVMIDEQILRADISINRFDRIICSMIPDKGIDSVRNQNKEAYAIVNKRDDNYRLWVENSLVNPVQATNGELCRQVAECFSPILMK